ncbi:phosphomevalonate kinase [Leuconostoc mesenteroides]
MTKILIPGKLFLAGEYAITNPGNAALIVAITTGLAIEINTAHEFSTITSNIITDDLTLNINQKIPEQTDDWRFVRAAVNLMAQYIHLKRNRPTLQEINIDIKSNMNHRTGKIGLGSSAAVVVGIVSALNNHFKLNLTLLTQFKIAALAHLHVQKNGSLGDVAAITYGGVIAYQSPDLSQYQTADKNWLQPDIVDVPWKKLNIVPLEWPQNWQILLGATHESADTSKALSSKTLSTSFFKESQHITDDVVQAVINNDYEQFSKSLRLNQTVLRNTLSQEYVTPKLDMLLQTLGSTAGKISGAGFGDNGFAVVNGPTDLPEKWLSAEIEPHYVQIAPQNRG